MTTEEEYKYNCEKCDYHTNNNRYFIQHKKRKKHIKNYEKELKEEKKKIEEDNKDKKYKCIKCCFYTDSMNSFCQHKRTKKHKENVDTRKKLNKHDFGLIYLLRLRDDYYKFGMSKNCELKRLKGYNGIKKIEKQLYVISVKNNKKFEKILKNNFKDYRYYEGITKEYFKWNYDEDIEKNDKKLVEIFIKELNNYIFNNK
jgi:hypothetical protein